MYIPPTIYMRPIAEYPTMEEVYRRFGPVPMTEEEEEEEKAAYDMYAALETLYTIYPKCEMFVFELIIYETCKDDIEEFKRRIKLTKRIEGRRLNSYDVERVHKMIDGKIELDNIDRSIKMLSNAFITVDEFREKLGL